MVADACRSLPGLAGFVGFDLIASKGEPRVRILDANPRLTTSYVGYRRLTHENLAARMLFVDVDAAPIEWNIFVPSRIKRSVRVPLAACPPVFSFQTREEDTGGQAEGVPEFNVLGPSLTLRVSSQSAPTRRVSEGPRKHKSSEFPDTGGQAASATQSVEFDADGSIRVG